MSIARMLIVGGIVVSSALLSAPAPTAQGNAPALTERDRDELTLLSARYSFALGTCDDKTWPDLFVAPNGYFASGSRGQVLGRCPQARHLGRVGPEAVTAAQHDP